MSPGRPAGWSDPSAPANAALRERVVALAGESRITDVSRPVGRRSIVWRLARADGSVWFLKRCEESRLFGREQQAYREVLPHLGSEPWFRLPALIEAWPDIDTVVISGVSGAPIDAAGDRLAVYRSAGRFMRLLHELPAEHIPDTTLGGPAHERLGAFLDGAEAYVDEATVTWTHELLSDPAAFAGARRVVVHADYHPRNWLWDESGATPVLGVIDWERLRPSIVAEDMHRLGFRDWVEDPRTKDAFLEGYGRRLTQHEERQAALLTLLSAVGGVRWALERGDTVFAELNRTLIERLRPQLS